MLHVNQRAKSNPMPRAKVMAALGREGWARAQGFFAACPIHMATPLISLNGFASQHGLASVHIKDEGQRLGLKSFKALGGAYAVMALVVAAAEKALGRKVEPSELQSPDVRRTASAITVCCATDGNHGKSVAAGARIVGCQAKILMHQGVSATRAAAIAAFGAEVIRVDGSYDDSVAEAARLAEANGWIVVSDTSYDGYEDIPLTVMQGYTIMAGEAFDALPHPPTHIFLQAGVGGLAAAVAAQAFDRYGLDMPKIIVVEPERAACLYASAVADRLTTVPHAEPTIMGMLECYVPSQLAWEVLAPMASAFLTLPEEAAIDSMRSLARPLGGDQPIVAGESGGAGFAGLLACLNDEGARHSLALNSKSRILAIVSEGATDPDIYRQCLGFGPEEVVR